MKKFLVVLLSLGLILAFSMTASAATELKFSGSWYVVGVYDNNQSLKDTEGTYSRAFYYTRTRVQPVFQVAEGLSLVTRFDALEKQWGQTDWRGGFDDRTNSRRQQQQVTTPANSSPKIQESFEFERAYVSFRTAAGQFDIGYMSSGKWGTDAGDDENTRPRIRWQMPMGNAFFGAVVEKFFEADNAQNPGYQASGHDVGKDNDGYYLYGGYNFSGGSAGALLRHFNYGAGTIPVATAYKTKVYTFDPYVKATFGPVYFEGEFSYQWGKAREYAVETVTNKNIDLSAYLLWLYAKANLGPAYLGGSFLYSSGDDQSDPTKAKTTLIGSPDLNIGLILGFDSLQTWEGSNGPSTYNGLGNNGNGQPNITNGGKQNMWMLSLFAGFNPTPKSNVEFLMLKAMVNEVSVKTPNQDKDLGWEFDLTGSYKIFDNLTYKVGAGLLLAGDYFLGPNPTGKTRGNDFLLMNQLTLNF